MLFKALLLFTFTFILIGCSFRDKNVLEPESVDLPIRQAPSPLLQPPLAEESPWGVGLQPPLGLDFERPNFLDQLPFVLEDDFVYEVEAAVGDLDAPDDILAIETAFTDPPLIADNWLANTHIPSFIIGGGVGGFQGFDISVSQEEQSGSIRVEGTNLQGVPFSGRFLLILRSPGAEDVVIEVPASVLNQYEGNFIFDISPSVHFPVFQTYAFLTCAHTSFETYSQMILRTTQEFFEPHREVATNAKTTELNAGWLHLSEFVFLESYNRWEFTAFRPYSSEEPSIFDILFLDSTGNPLAILTINPNFHIFEEGEARRLNISNSEDLSLVESIDARCH